MNEKKYLFVNLLIEMYWNILKDTSRTFPYNLYFLSAILSD